MTTNASSSSPLDVLHAAGIITAEHHRQALAHPTFGEFSRNPSLTDHLLWMRIDNIIDEDVLEQAEAHVAATFTGDERARYLAAIEGALGLVLEIDELHKVCLRQLLKADWITRDECDRALAAIGLGESSVTGPGGMLAWMAGQGIIGPDRLTAIRAAGNPAGDLKKARMLDNLEWVLGQPARQRRKWIFRIVGLLAAGLVAWAMFRPAPIPDCSTGGTRHTIEQERAIRCAGRHSP
ncbi:hypothetical protein [Pseudoduganella lutea]|uniref:Uncharacterized protein n=1 Tax=Pseudoduganella lutea TaxID=321985 RepID=A0A4P6KXW0_9BURK|nr:hypothetical protein [Pseudoduganella lutea]QBE64011.1 hypothetical protein EWM63_14260 [Pseudoduganella lutea]